MLVDNMEFECSECGFKYDCDSVKPHPANGGFICVDCESNIKASPTNYTEIPVCK